jgi:glucose-6-phosphate-specific signal transduction histidine kinase
LSNIMGKVRPSGTFSFNTGAAHIFQLATAFLIFGLSRNRTYPRWLLAASLISVTVVQPVSGSRTLVLGCALVFVAAILFGVFHPNQSKRTLMIAVLATALVAALSFTSFFREAMETFKARWDSASASTGGVQHGIIGRFFNEFVEPFEYLPQAGLIGKGLGMGTNAASALLTGALVFLLAEGEWARVVLEVGPFLGFAFLAYRVWLGMLIALRAVRGARLGQLLPWLLVMEACRSVIAEQLSQPTNLGFTVFVCGLCLAAFSENWAPVESAITAWEPVVESETAL